VMSTTKLAVLEFLSGCRSGWRGLSLGAALLCACSVYDSRLLPGRGSGGITENDSGPGTDVADGGKGDAALVECKPASTRAAAAARRRDLCGGYLCPPTLPRWLCRLRW